MATKQPGVWGIDIGQCALKALRLEKINDVITATAFDFIEYPKILSQPDAEPDALIREALEQFLSRNNIRGDQIAISVAGQTGLARFVKLPPVEAKKIPDIVKFEAKQQIPFSLDDVVWDWQIIGTQGGGEGFVENEIGLFAIKKDMIYRALQALKDVKVEVHLVQMAPLSLCNFVAYDLLNKEKTGGGGGDHECIVAMDMGVDNTNLVVTDGERIIWQRAIPIGGNHFTRALTKEMKLTFAKAEHLKRNATKAEDPKKIFASMKPVFADFVGELQRSLSFFTNSHRNAQIKRMLGLGNAFRLPGLQKFVSQSMGIEVEKINEFNRLVGDEVRQSPVYADNVLSFAVAYGLALQGMDVTRISTNLLPQDIRMERLIRSKKPWALSAAAALLFGIGVFAIGSGAQWSKASETKKEADSAKTVMEESNRKKAAYQQEQQELIKARQAATLILRGSEERVNWGLFNRLINECLPQPNGTNLPTHRLDNNVVPYEKYFGQNDRAQRAWTIKEERDRAGIRNDEINASVLVQINIQAIWARYCDTSMATNFFTQVKQRSTISETVDPNKDPDWKEAPKQPGWAIEIRGFTYHQDAHHFVRETFLENLKKKKSVFWPVNSPYATPVKMDTSHVAILLFETVDVTQNPNPAFTKISSSNIFLNELLKSSSKESGGAGAASGGSGGGGGAGAMMLDPGATSSGDSSSTQSQGSFKLSSPRNSEWSGLSPIGSVVGDNLAAGAKAIQEDAKKRTEFVIVLYWVEPLPTEPQSTAPVAPK